VSAGEIYKLPDTGEVALTRDTIVDADDLQRFIAAGGTIYTRGYQVEARENGGSGPIVCVKPRKASP
jgi:hypothetical protein